MHALHNLRLTNVGPERIISSLKVASSATKCRLHLWAQDETRFAAQILPLMQPFRLPAASRAFFTLFEAFSSCMRRMQQPGLHLFSDIALLEHLP